MNMSGEVRVKTDAKYRYIYNELKSCAVGDMHELFFICVCLGYRARKKKVLGTNGDPRFWSRTITPEEFTCYYAIMLEVNGMELSAIKDDKSVLAEMEKYANAGMEILFDEYLSDYLITSSDELKLDPSSSKELPRSLLHFIYEQLQ